MNTYTEDDLRAALTYDADRGAVAVDVWPRLQRGIVVRRRVRVGVAVAAVAAVATVVAVAVPRGEDSVQVPPAQGHGPTRFEPDHALSQAALAASADVLRHRLDVLGVAGATITTHDGSVDIAAPHTSDATLAAITARGLLEFRPVEGIAPATSCPTAGGGTVACNVDGTIEYTLGPAALHNSDIASASAVDDSVGNQWLVDIQFYRAGAEKFHTLTAQAAAKPDQGSGCQPPTGCNAIAIVLDGVVLSAPSVQPSGGISGGETQITGNLTRAEAQVLAALAATGPLPTGFSAAPSTARA